MNAKATKKTSAAMPALKFEKGAWYEDQKGNAWVCTNGKLRKTADQHQVVDMQKVENGTPTGEPGEEYTDIFVKRLSKAEVAEIKAVAKREAEALAAAQKPASTEKPAEAKVTVGETVKTPEAKKTRKTKAAKEDPAGERKLGALDAAAKVLEEAGTPMSCKEMIEAMATKGLWTSPGGKTPHATLCSAILREMTVKGDESRFKKTDRGRFAFVTAK